MNLRDFIAQKSKCPICDSLIITRFISHRQQTVRLIEDRFVSIHTMKPMRNSQPDYQVGYSFGMDDNSFCIEFYTEWDTSNQVPMHLIDKFKEFHKNLMGPNYRFARHCLYCHKYILFSKEIILDLKNPKIPDLQNEIEQFIFMIRGEDNYKAIKLTNKLLEKPSSELRWWLTDSEGYARVDKPIPTRHSVLNNLAFIPFISKEKTSSRLNSLILFA